MRRMKIRATPNFGGGGGPRTTPVRSSGEPAAVVPSSAPPSSALPSTAVPCTTTTSTGRSSLSASFMPPPSTASTIVAPKYSQTRVNVPSSLAEEKSTVTAVATSGKPYSKSAISDDSVKVVFEDRYTSLNVQSHKSLKMVEVDSMSLPVFAQTHNISHKKSISQCEASSPEDIRSPDDPALLSDVSTENHVFSASQRSSISSLSRLPVPTSVLSQISVVSKSLPAASSEGRFQFNRVMPSVKFSVKDTVTSQASVPVKFDPSESTQQKTESRPVTNIRRKKIKIMPMVSGSRKGDVAEKSSTRFMNAEINKVKFDVEVECLGEKLGEVPDKAVKNVDVECLGGQLGAMPEQKLRNASGSDNQARQFLIQNKRASYIEVNAPAEEIQQILTNEGTNIITNIQPPTTSLARMQVESRNGNKYLQTHLHNKSSTEEVIDTRVLTKSEKLIVAEKGETSVSLLENKGLELKDKNRSSIISNVDTSSAVTLASCKRRSKFRATPTFLSKRKMEKKFDIVEEKKKDDYLEVVEEPILEESTVQEKSHRENNGVIVLDSLEEKCDNEKSVALLENQGLELEDEIRSTIISNVGTSSSVTLASCKTRSKICETPTLLVKKKMANKLDIVDEIKDDYLEIVEEPILEEPVLENPTVQEKSPRENTGVIVLDRLEEKCFDEISSALLVDNLLQLKENNQSSIMTNMDTSSTATLASCKRRSRIRAIPTVLSKRKMEKKLDIGEEKIRDDYLEVVEEPELEIPTVQEKSPSENTGVIVLDGSEENCDVETIVTLLENKGLESKDENRSSVMSNVDTNSAATLANCKRRARIRAIPSLLSKKKMEKKLDIVDEKIRDDYLEVVEEPVLENPTVQEKTPSENTGVIVLDSSEEKCNDETSVALLKDKGLELKNENQSSVISNVGTSSATTIENCKRRSRIRATPTLFYKKKLMKKLDIIQEKIKDDYFKVVEEPILEKTTVQEETRSENTGVIVLDSLEEKCNGETSAALLENKGLKLKDDNQSSIISYVDTSSAGRLASCKRRSRIRATPTFLAKKKIVSKLDIIVEEIKDDYLEVVEEPVLEKPTVQEKSRSKNTGVIVLDSLGNKCDIEPVCDESPVPSISVNPVHEPCILKVSEPKMLHKEANLEIENKDCNLLEGRQKRAKSDQSYIRRDGVEIIEDNSSNDDSNGNKENSSLPFSSSKTTKKESTLKGRSKSQALLKTKAKPKPIIANLKRASVKAEKKVKDGVSNDDGLSSDDFEEITEKQIFRDRKEKYRKKMSKGALERSSMTMFDLIFWNPATNPMPGRPESSKKRVRLSSKCETESISSDVIEEQRLDDLGLDTSDPAPQSSPSSDNETQVLNESSEAPNLQVIEAKEEKEEEEKEKKEEEEKEKNEEEKEEEKKEEGKGEEGKDEEGKGEEDEEDRETTLKDIFAPRVKIGPNGRIILDEKSIKIQTTAAKNRDEILSRAEVVEESNDSAHYGKWSKKRHRSSEWTMKETARFYKALSTVGTDFSLMETLFTWRSRAELKTKFKKEERFNRDLVDRALKDSTQFDFSLFDDESDYDPEEDRKATRIAERAEVKRRRLEMKQSVKEQEKELKDMEKKKKRAKIQKHKRVLRKECKKRRRRKRGVCGSDNNEGHDCVDQDLAVINTENANQAAAKKSLVSVKKKIKKKRATIRRPVKRKQLERRNSLVISEVTVTMETVKYDASREPNNECVVEKTIVENSEGDVEIIETPSSTTPSGAEAILEIESAQNMWHFPVSAIQTHEDGRQTILVPAADGQKIVPVPLLPPGTSNVVVVATEAPDLPGEQIYHVYVVSPLEGTES